MIEQKPFEGDWVDLGLPSGTLWKISNETDPNDNDHDFYTYDEAMQKFGDQLPTKEQWEELKGECRWTWANNCYKVTGPNGNSIFLRAAGYRHCSGWVSSVGVLGIYWSSTSRDSGYAWCLGFGSSGVYMSRGFQCYDQSVRLVNKN